MHTKEINESYTEKSCLEKKTKRILKEFRDQIYYYISHVIKAKQY